MCRVCHAALACSNGVTVHWQSTCQNSRKKREFDKNTERMHLPPLNTGHGARDVRYNPELRVRLMSLYSETFMSQRAKGGACLGA